MLLNKVLYVGNKKLYNRENNSLKNLFEQLCAIHMFISIIVVANFVQCALSYKGTHASYRASKPSNTSSSSMHRSSGMWCSSSCPIFSCSLAIASTISQAHCTSPTMGWWWAQAWCVWFCLKFVQWVKMGPPQKTIY